MRQIVYGDMASNDRVAAADRALQWFVALQSGTVTQADRRAFQEWIRADALHREEFESCVRLWGELDSVKPLLSEELAQAESDWRQAAQRVESGAVWGWTSAWSSAVGACLLVAAIAGGGWIWMGGEAEEYRTAKGERRTILLSDGSTITMNTETVVATEYSRFRRAVVLREGEALFAVSHADSRSFTVMAEGRVIRDVGTRFAVRREEQSVTVTVVEGAVEVQQFEQAAAAQSWQVLTAGEQVSYEWAGALSSVKSVSSETVTAWVEGKVVFEDRPLSEVIREVRRYQAGEIRILDPQVGDLKVSGVFRANDRDGLLKALEHAVPVAVSRVNNGMVVIERKNSLQETR